MKKIIAKIKGFTRRLAIYFVTIYANRIYRRAVESADKRHEELGETIYVANGVANAKILRTYTRAEFRRVKRLMHIYKSDKFTIPEFRKGCWYHTPDRSEKNALSPQEKELRRLAFVKLLLMNAKLV